MLDALEELGLNVSDFKKEIAPDPKRSFFKFEFEKFTLDLLPQLNGLTKFSLSYKNRVSITLEDAEILFLNYEDLIKNKKFKKKTIKLCKTHNSS